MPPRQSEVDEDRLWRLADPGRGVGVAHDDVGWLDIEVRDADLVHGVETRANSKQ